MFPRFIRVVACARFSFLFMAEPYSIVRVDHICLSIHPSVGTWVGRYLLTVVKDAAVGVVDN